LAQTTLQDRKLIEGREIERGPCKTRSGFWSCGLLLICLSLLPGRPLRAQQSEADLAWSQGRYDAAERAYLQLLRQSPGDVRGNLRIGVMLSWRGKLDSALVHLARARAGDPTDVELRLIQARVMAWNRQYQAALIRYDSILGDHPGLRDALLGRARTLAWSGQLQQSGREFGQILARDSSDVEAMLGRAQVSAWNGDLSAAEQGYRKLLAANPRDVEARVGLGYVYLWQGREGAAGRQAKYALAIDSSHKAGRDLQRQAREATRPSAEGSVNWSNDSDENTSFWQTLGSSASLGGGVSLFGSVNALETSDPVREASRVGGEAGLSLRAGRLQLQGAAGARRLAPETAPTRTVETYRARAVFRPIPQLSASVGYSRLPFDEIAALIERELDLESLDGGVDLRPAAGLTLYGGAGGLWLSDGNSRTSFSAGVNQKIARKYLIGVFGRTLSFDRRGVGYFSPDRFSVLEGVAGYSHESPRWALSLSGGLGAQQVGERGAAQSEWHLEGRIGPRWGSGNRLELFGLVTNSAVSSTTGAFRYRAAGLTARIGL